MKLIVNGVVWAAILSSSVVRGQPQSPSFMGLGDFPDGNFESYANGVSADGSVVVGTGHTSENGNSIRRAFKWTLGGGLEELPTGACFLAATECSAVSGDGKVIVGYSGAFSSGAAVVWTDWGIVNLDTTSCSYPTLEAVDASGDGRAVVGKLVTTNGAPFMAVWSNNELHLPVGQTGGGPMAIAEDGLVVGQNSTGVFTWRSGMEPQFIYSEGTLASISSDGTVVGGSSASFANATRWTSQCGVESLDIPGTAYAVSGDGMRVGVQRNANEGWIWDAVDGARSLSSYLGNELNLTEADGWDLYRPMAFSIDGTVVVGRGRNASGDQEGWIAYLPEITIIRGDFTDDGVVDMADVSGFCAVLVAPCDATIRNRYAADMNDDRFVDAVDIGLFTQELLNP